MPTTHHTRSILDDIDSDIGASRASQQSCAAGLITQHLSDLLRQAQACKLMETCLLAAGRYDDAQQYRLQAEALRLASAAYRDLLEERP